MSDGSLPGVTVPGPAHATGEPEPSLGELVARLSEQTSRLVRDEMRLAQAEMTEKGKRAGIGVGLFGGAGLFAVYGLGALVAAAIMGLARAVDGWLAAIIVGVALFVLAGLGALVGKTKVQQATPPLPEEAVGGMKRDAQILKSGSGA